MMNSEKQWIRPAWPEKVKIKAAQRVRSAQENSKHFAVRYIFEEPSEFKIKSSGKIFPIPEFGAMAYNAEFYEGVAVFEWKLKEPIDCDGIVARLRAEVWKIQNGSPKLLVEEWFASELPENCRFSEFITGLLDGLNRQEKAELARLAPKPAESFKRLSRNDEETKIDHRRNVRDVCERLLRREYPQTYRALDIKAGEEEVRKAFIADNISNTGVAPDVEGLEALLHDKKFIDWLFTAAEKRGHKVPPEEWTLATGWVKWGFFRMKDQELEKVLNEKTGLALKGNSWRRRARRLGLVNACKQGRPEKPNCLPPCD
jgi:hypothetical protein